MAGSELLRDGLVGVVLILYKRGLSRGEATCALPLIFPGFEPRGGFGSHPKRAAVIGSTSGQGMFVRVVRDAMNGGL
ncbi:MAG: hypothetical protein A3E01_11520 [Gammaproteobacteria bacterium RIFCSPHIGHO2_12_FULL_63_22]|nr:MAG: hypothetical protein A3E01_11520 [Gammaproteobacteria bacterium RIFCSPHIGHO2_12_FULL_63_22]